MYTQKGEPVDMEHVQQLYDQRDHEKRLHAYMEASQPIIQAMANLRMCFCNPKYLQRGEGTYEIYNYWTSDAMEELYNQYEEMLTMLRKTHRLKENN